MVKLHLERRGVCGICGQPGFEVEYFDGIMTTTVCEQHLAELEEDEAELNEEENSLETIDSPEQAVLMAKKAAEELNVGKDELLDPHNVGRFLSESARLRKVIRFFGDAKEELPSGTLAHLWK